MSTERSEEKSEEKPKSVDDVIDRIGFGRFQVVTTVLCGSAQACDMMEIQFANLVSQKLQCVWYISDFSKSLVTSATFAGLWLGSLLWGPLADVYSRVKVAGVAMAFVVFYGFLTAFAPTMLWVLLLRFLVGVGIGGVQPVSGTVLNEFTPSERRGFVWFVYQGIWCFGGVFELSVAWPLLSFNNGWRMLAIASAAPMLLLTFLWLALLPESPRQCMLMADYSGARHSVNEIARINGRPPFTGDFKFEKSKKRGELASLIRSFYYARVTLLCVLINFCGGFGYYGIILLNLQVPLVLHDQCRLQNMTPAEIKLDRMCHSCSDMNYLEMLVPTLADMATAVFSAVFVEKILTRKATMALSFGIAATLMPLLSLCMSTWLQTLLFFTCRFIIITGYNFISLYVQEVYPTSLRSTAASFHVSFSRVAAILVPFVAQLFIKQVSVIGGLCIFSGILALACISVLLLPTDTKGQPLRQTIESDENDTESDEMPMEKHGGEYGSFRHD